MYCIWALNACGISSATGLVHKLIYELGFLFQKYRHIQLLITWQVLKKI